MKTTVYCLLSCLLLASTAVAAETSVYLVDVQRVLDESIAGKAARSDMEEMARKEEAGFAIRQKEFAREQEELGRQKGLLSSEALEEKSISLEKRHREFMREVQDKSAEISKRGNAQMEKVISQMDKVIAEMTASGQYPYVLEKDPRVVVYSNEKYDLTSEVIKRLNKISTGL